MDISSWIQKMTRKKVKELILKGFKQTKIRKHTTS